MLLNVGLEPLSSPDAAVQTRGSMPGIMVHSALDMGMCFVLKNVKPWDGGDGISFLSESC